MTELVLYLLLFLVIGSGFVFFHLAVIGKVARPVKPDPDKLTIYECGEPTIGSSWIQFDLRFYVVALLFVIFDVEVAFFFPWAVVFGNANKLAGPGLRAEQRLEFTKQLVPDATEPMGAGEAHQLAIVAFWDILIFFGVLLVGFAYLWRRGDLDWVRSLSAEKLAEGKEAIPVPGPETAPAKELVAAGGNGW